MSDINLDTGRSNTLKYYTCIKCNQELPSEAFYYHRTRHIRITSCKKCNNEQSRNYQATKRNDNDNSFRWYARATDIRRRCKYDGRECSKDLTNILRGLWDKQNGLCYYTGLPMTNTNDYHSGNPNVATVDRIDSSKGYIEGNVVLCCSIVNRMKQNMSITELVNMCKIIVAQCDKME